MTFESAEGSVQDSEPRELFEFQISPPTGVVYRHTSATRDIQYNGNFYTAIPIKRSAIGVLTTEAKEKEVEVLLPVDHALVRRYFAQGLPPKRISFTLRRQNGGQTETLWAGDVTSLSVSGGTARILIPSRAGAWMLRPIPSATITQSCPLILYSTLCGVSRAGSSPGGVAHQCVTTIISVNGRVIRVDLGDTDRNGTWAENGEVLHVASAERMTVRVQTDVDPGSSSVADLTMQSPIYGLKVGDTAHVFAGCDHAIAGLNGCTPKFGNRQNYGGMPHLQDKNIFLPGSYGLRTVL